MRGSPGWWKWPGDRGPARPETSRFGGRLRNCKTSGVVFGEMTPGVVFECAKNNYSRRHFQENDSRGHFAYAYNPRYQLNSRSPTIEAMYAAIARNVPNGRRVCIDRP